jgi:hypothetical protein
MIDGLDVLKSDLKSSGLAERAAGSSTYLLRQIISADVEG